MTENSKGKPRERTLPKVSKAKGGLMRGFDWDNLAAQIEEMDDLEYIERMRRGFEPTPEPSPSPHPRRGGR
jgi:hypothetical protein